MTDEAYSPACRVMASRRRVLGHWGALGMALVSAGGVTGTMASGLPAVIARVRRSVVAVGYFQPTASPRFQFRGSGWVTGDGRLVVTNSHVLAEDGRIPEPGERLMVMVPSADGSRSAREPRMANVMRREAATDLALLELEGRPLPALNLATEPATEGLEIALLGYPLGSVLGLSPVVHRGIVSSVVDITLPAPQAQALTARNAARLRSGAFEIYQLDAKAHPGNSGGPVIHAATGEVVGVINMVLIRAGRESSLSEPTGISYAIPAAQVRTLLAQTP